MKRRHKITITDIIAERRKRKAWEKEQQQRDELLKRCHAIQKGVGPQRRTRLQRQLEKAVGVKTKKQWDTMPIQKLTEAVERFLKEEGTG